MSCPEDLLALAKTLSVSPGASRRAAISRAYYAAFHALQDALDPMMATSDLGPNGCATHAAVQRKLARWSQLHPDKKKAMGFGAQATIMAQRLQYCREERERADYHMGPAGEVDLPTANGVIAKAEAVIKFAVKAA